MSTFLTGVEQSTELESSTSICHVSSRRAAAVVGSDPNQSPGMQIALLDAPAKISSYSMTGPLQNSLTYLDLFAYVLLPNWHGWGQQRLAS